MKRINLSRDIIKTISEEAKNDGKITREEFMILSQLTYDLPNFESMLKTALADDHLDKKEISSLDKLKMEIIDNAIKVANFDDNVDADEAHLIKTLTELLAQYMNKYS